MTQERGVRDRVAAQSPMATVVDAHRSAPRRRAIDRIFGRSPLAPRVRAAYDAAVAELIVGDLLDGLGPQWDVLHDVPLGSSTLDHLVIGPAGILAVRVVHAADRDVVADGALLVSGVPTDDLAEAIRQARVAAEHLGDAAGERPRVDPVLVVVRPRRLVVRSDSARLRVVSSEDLVRSLIRARRALDGVDVARWSDLADRASTWPVASSASADLAMLHRAFEHIRAEVRAAERRRISWVIGLMLAGFAAIWGLVALLTVLLAH